MTFFESLKKWFYTKNSSAASSDARVPLLDASGNPKGSDTMANLASVLGGLFPNITNSNANNITTAGTYFFVGGGGAPSDNGILNVTITGIYANGERRIVQHFAKVGVKHFYIRQGYIVQGESPVWYDWCELTIDMPTFYKDYSTLDALKTGLGVYERVHLNNGTFTINDAAGCLIYIYISGAVSGALYYIDFWSTQITRVCGSSKIEDYVTMSKAENQTSITLTNTSSGIEYTLIK